MPAAQSPSDAGAARSGVLVPPGGAALWYDQ